MYGLLTHQVSGDLDVVVRIHEVPLSGERLHVKPKARSLDPTDAVLVSAGKKMETKVSEGKKTRVGGVCCRHFHSPRYPYTSKNKASCHQVPVMSSHLRQHCEMWNGLLPVDRVPQRRKN